MFIKTFHCLTSIYNRSIVFVQKKNWTSFYCKKYGKINSKWISMNSIHLFIYLLFLSVGKRGITVEIPKTLMKCTVLHIHTMKPFHNVETMYHKNCQQRVIKSSIPFISFFFSVFKRKSMVMIYDLWKWQNYVCFFSKMFNHIQSWIKFVRLNSCLHWMAPSKWHWGFGWINGMCQNLQTWSQPRPRRRRRKKKIFRTCCFIASKSQIGIKT